MMPTRFLALVAAACFSSSALAQAWPARPVTIVVPYQAGGTNDIVARLVGAHLGPRLGVPVVVENRSGAGGNIGARHVARAAPDGYTIGAVPTGVLAINQWVYPDAGFDPARDLVPIALAGRVPNVLVAHPALPAATVEELVRHARANPGRVSLASMGTGTTGHLCGEMFKLKTGTDMPHVPYKGAAPALADLMAGHVGLMCDNITNALPHIKAGKLKALAVTSRQRSPMLPDTPTLDEAGLPGFEATAWFGFVAPAGVPPAILARLDREIVAALGDDKIRQQLAGLGMLVAAESAPAFARFVDDERQTWKNVVEQSGARAQ